MPALTTRGKKTPFDKTGGTEAGMIPVVTTGTSWVVAGGIMGFVTVEAAMGVVMDLTKVKEGPGDCVAVCVTGCFCR